MDSNYRFCPSCATSLARITLIEEGAEKERLRCPSCNWTHWNNPTPVLAAVVEYHGQILLARNAAWQNKFYALITGFMEAGETPHQGISREIKEETNLDAQELQLIGVYDFQRRNQVIIAYHARCVGEVSLSPELVDYKLYAFDQVRCWPSGTGFALADWLRSSGHEPQFMENWQPPQPRAPEVAS